MQKCRLFSFILILFTTMVFMFPIASCDENSNDVINGILNSRIEFDTPKDGAVVNDIVNITGAAIGVENVTLKFKDTEGKIWGVNNAVLMDEEWEFLWDTTEVPDGEYKIKAYGDQDNGLAFATIHVNVQNNMPEVLSIEIKSPLADREVKEDLLISGVTTGPAVRIEVRILNETSGTDLLIDNVEGIQEWSCNLNTLLLANDDYTIKAGAYDALENEEVHEISIIVNNPETLNPVVTINSPEDGDIWSDSKIVTGNFEDVEDIEVQIIDSAGNVSHSGNAVLLGSEWRYPFNTLNFPDGLYTIQATGDNGAAEDSVSMRVQNTVSQELSITIDEPTSEKEVNGMLTIKGTTTGPAERVVVRIQNYSNGVYKIINAAGTATWSCSFDTRTIEDERYSLWAHVYDSSNNYKFKYIYINVKNGSNPPNPEVTITSPNNGDTMPPNVLIKGNYSDVESVKIEIREAAGGLVKSGDAELLNGSWTFQWNTSGLTERDYEIKAIGGSNQAEAAISVIVNDGISDDTRWIEIGIVITDSLYQKLGSYEESRNVAFTIADYIDEIYSNGDFVHPLRVKLVELKINDNGNPYPLPDNPSSGSYLTAVQEWRAEHFNNNDGSLFLVNRFDLGGLGFSHGDMCSQTSAIWAAPPISIDPGKDNYQAIVKRLGAIAAHELGHMLGLSHDGVETTCYTSCQQDYLDYFNTMACAPDVVTEEYLMKRAPYGREVEFSECSIFQLNMAMTKGIPKRYANQGYEYHWDCIDSNYRQLYEH